MSEEAYKDFRAFLKINRKQADLLKEHLAKNGLKGKMAAACVSDFGRKEGFDFSLGDVIHIENEKKQVEAESVTAPKQDRGCYWYNTNRINWTSSRGELALRFLEDVGSNDADDQVFESSTELISSRFIRVVEMLNSHMCTFISAYRHNDELNKQHTKELMNDLKKAGYQYYRLEGRYKYENGKTETETSLMVTNLKDTERTVFIEDMIALGIKYDQQCIMVTLPKEKESTAYTAVQASSMFIATDLSSEDTPVGSILRSCENVSISNIEDYYSKVHVKGFVFL